MRPIIACWVLFALLFGMAFSGCLGQGDTQTQDADEGDEGDDGEADQAGGGPEEEEDDGENGSGGNETDDGTGGGDGAGDGNETDEGDDGQDEGEDGNSTGAYDPGWPEVSQASIRPGVKIAGGCTANFVFSSPDNRSLYIGTASHCVAGSSIGDSVQIAGIQGAGTVAYCSWMYTEGEGHCPGEDTDLLLDGNDFALVEVSSVHRDEVHPSMLYWGGPMGVGAAPGLGEKVHMYGNSGTKPLEDLRIVEGYVARSGTVTNGIYSLPPGIPGDSGSAVMTSDGEAVGIFVGIGITGGLPAEGVVSNLDNALEYLEENAGLEVELKTWGLDNPALLPG